MINIINLKNKNIVVTGASSGIGRQCAITASKLGANIVLIGRNTESLKETQRQLDEGKHLVCVLDIREYDKLEQTIENAVNELGPLSGFVHSAGVEVTLPLRSMEIENYNDLFSTNVISGFELARIISKKKYLLENSSSSFVFISSIRGLLGQKGNIGYCGSKGAVISGARAMALELADKNIRVNSVLPGMVRTDMTKKTFDRMSKEAVESIEKMHPLGFGDPTDVANLVVFLLSDASKWITGASYTVDGGYSAQ